MALLRAGTICSAAPAATREKSRGQERYIRSTTNSDKLGPKNQRRSVEPSITAERKGHQSVFFLCRENDRTRHRALPIWRTIPLCRCIRQKSVRWWPAAIPCSQSHRSSLRCSWREAAEGECAACGAGVQPMHRRRSGSDGGYVPGLIEEVLQFRARSERNRVIDTLRKGQWREKNGRASSNNVR